MIASAFSAAVEDAGESLEEYQDHMKKNQIERGYFIFIVINIIGNTGF